MASQKYGLMILGMLLSVVIFVVGFICGVMFDPVFQDTTPKRDTLSPNLAGRLIDFDVVPPTLWMDDPRREFGVMPPLRPWIDPDPHGLVGKSVHMLHWCLKLEDLDIAIIKFTKGKLRDYVRAAGNTCLSSVQNMGRDLSGKVTRWIKDRVIYDREGRRTHVAIYDMGKAFRGRTVYSWVAISTGLPTHGA